METKQTGWTIIFVFAITLFTFILFSILMPPQGEGGVLILAFSPVLLIVMLLFYQLTVKVDRETIKIRFGIGLIRKSWKLSAIESAAPVRNSFFHGWGIHYTLNTAVYNVSGFSAVELSFRHSKRKVRIGTSEPERLAGYINRLLEKDGRI
ncbi:hypothetical protein SDC9_24392 [bioreactor metagenome]|jgi:hypothetical protein|uniref:DUF304 domain-containing protein n=1 Tax=bioreactor metagenome TaxID=1076179 RepID=A0A644UI86_9ZZZZ|nr:hypothetical protein [Lentimicrobium sp.]MEA5109635.1 hypothetical protein [Lentimicrobium sp.]HCT71357.1 hypothetical protein [Bacteroidales bacterium]